MEGDRRAALQLLQAGDTTLNELWLAFFALGGNAGQLELEAYIFGLISLSALDEDLLAVAVTELQDE